MFLRSQEAGTNPSRARSCLSLCRVYLCGVIAQRDMCEMRKKRVARNVDNPTHNPFCKNRSEKQRTPRRLRRIAQEHHLVVSRFDQLARHMLAKKQSLRLRLANLQGDARLRDDSTVFQLTCRTEQKRVGRR